MKKGSIDFIVFLTPFLPFFKPGLGTYVSPGIWGYVIRHSQLDRPLKFDRGISSTIAKAADMAVAWYLEAHGTMNNQKTRVIF